MFINYCKQCQIYNFFQGLRIAYGSMLWVLKMYVPNRQHVLKADIKETHRISYSIKKCVL